jgi:hypothetical protein
MIGLGSVFIRTMVLSALKEKYEIGPNARILFCKIEGNSLERRRANM